MTKIGLVIAHQGVKIVVKGDDNEVFAYPIKRNSDFVVGDEVSIEISHPLRLPRRNVLQRQTPYGLQSIAANLDGVGIVIAQLPPVPRLFIDQVIMATRSQNIRPFIVVNKIDLPESQKLITWIRDTFSSEMPIITVSARNDIGVDNLLELVKELGRCILVGVSGVGKSSLLNALVGEAIQRTSVTVDKDRHGQHTTSQSILFSLRNGGELIDSPGVRDFSPPHLAPLEISQFFIGFAKTMTEHCHFRNCLHVGEPGCQIKMAVKSGAINTQRYETYLELLAISQLSLTQRR